MTKVFLYQFFYCARNNRVKAVTPIFLADTLTRAVILDFKLGARQ